MPTPPTGGAGCRPHGMRTLGAFPRRHVTKMQTRVFPPSATSTFAPSPTERLQATRAAFGRGTGWSLQAGVAVVTVQGGGEARSCRQAVSGLRFCARQVPKMDASVILVCNCSDLRGSARYLALYGVAAKYGISPMGRLDPLKREQLLWFQCPAPSGCRH